MEENIVASVPSKSRLLDIAIVRLLLLTGVLLAGYVGFQLLALLVLPREAGARRDELLLLIFSGLCAAMAGLYWLRVKLIERRTPSELDLRPGLANLLVGLIVGGALFASAYAILFVMGIVRLSGFAGLDGLAAAFAIAAYSAIGEEIVFRGALFRVVEESAGTFAATAISAVVFALLHAGNPGATPISIAAIALEAGVLLGLSFAASRNLWLPIGIHFGWNFTEGGVFGAAVSGGRYQGLIHATLSGPTIWTGGTFGPEASLVAIIVCVPASAAAALYLVRNKRWKGARWRTRLA